MMRIFKWVLLSILLFLVVIVSFQNLTPTQLHFLFSTVELPLAVTLLVFLLVGFLLGILSSALWKVRAWRARQAKEKANKDSSSPQAAQ
jgi:uncharacterized integral membrane protein